MCINRIYNTTVGSIQLTRRSCAQKQRAGESPIPWFSVESKSVRFNRKERFADATNSGKRSTACVLNDIDPITSKNGLKVAKLRCFEVHTRASVITEYGGGVSIVPMLTAPLLLLLFLCRRCSLLLLA